MTFGSRIRRLWKRLVGPGNRKARKILVFARCLLFFLCYLLPLSCRRWAVASGLAVAPATEPGTVLTAALPWYLAPELPTLTAANGRRAYRRTACQRACRRAYCRRSTCRRATCHRAYRRNTVASATEHTAVGPTAPSGGRRSGRRRPPQVCRGVSLLGL